MVQSRLARIVNAANFMSRFEETTDAVLAA
jgi:hypothetical protein